MVIVVMGPAGAGKSTVGVALAERLGWTFVDADDHHAPASVAKIAAGMPLTENDRAGWLHALRGIVARAVDRRESAVLACSALKSHHRTRIAEGLRGVRFVYLKVPADILRERLRTRRGHFAKDNLLESQLATLEEPGEEVALIVNGAADIETVVGHIRLEFGV
jgi:gluconokinase